MLKESQMDDEVFIYRVDRKITHPMFSRLTREGDIGLLKLNDTVVFTKYIYPICLPTKQPDNSKAIATGFGTTGFSKIKSDHLLKVSLDMFSHNECQETFDDITYYSTSMLCYGHRTEEKDACDVF